MYKIDLRLKTLFSAIMGARDEASDVEFRVISENGIDIDKNTVVEDYSDEDDCFTDGDENPYAYFDTHDDKPFYDGPKLVVNDFNKIPKEDAILDDLNTCYSKSRNKTEIIIVYHYKDDNKPLQAQFYLDGDKTMLTKEEILCEIYDNL